MGKYLNKEFLLSNKELVIKVTVIALIIIVTFFVFVLKNDENKKDVYVDEQTTSESKEEVKNEERIVVDVGGAVKNPSVIELEGGSRIDDAIAAVGGLKGDADLTNINRAAFLTDGEKLYIPSVGETEIPGMPGSDSIADKVSLNTATSEELQALNGVGPATAEKILDYRQINGSFKTIEDLKNVSGIGEKTYEKLKDHITI